MLSNATIRKVRWPTAAIRVVPPWFYSENSEKEKTKKNVFSFSF
jgi:hypothetical protein